MALLCISLLFCASTAQACHAHDSLLRSGGGKHQLVAPVDECPLCMAPHAALLAESQATVAGTSQAEGIVVALGNSGHPAEWPFDLFSRPPPSKRHSAHAMAGRNTDL